MKRRADLSKPLEPILRVIYCGHCKSTWRMKGLISIRGKGIIRTFKCPSCQKIAKRDYFDNPSYMAVTTSDSIPILWYYNPEFKEYNQSLLETT